MTQKQHWHAGQDVRDGTVHIFPCGDTIEHEPDDCVCVPRFELNQTEDGDQWIYFHNAADGRPFEDPRDIEPQQILVFTVPVVAGAGVLGLILGFLTGRLIKR